MSTWESLTDRDGRCASPDSRLGSHPVECILLGTGGMMPMPERLLTSLAVRLNGRIYLFDAGEGTQLAWKKLRLGLRGLHVICLSHLHADHCLGIPGLMMLRAQLPDPSPLTLIGPPGTRKFVTTMMEILEFTINYKVSFVEWSEEAHGLAYRDERVRITWKPLRHTRFCLGYRLEEHERPGRFDPHGAEVLGIPRGPLWKALQSGKRLKTEDGREVSPEEVSGPPRRGRAIAFIVDTRPTPAVQDLCTGTDMAFIEAMFLSRHEELARERGHMTVAEAVKAASAAGAARIVLLHVSPRYRDGDLHLLEHEAMALNRRTVVGRDLDVYPIQLRD